MNGTSIIASNCIRITTVRRSLLQRKTEPSIRPTCSITKLKLEPSVYSTRRCSPYATAAARAPCSRPGHVTRPRDTFGSAAAGDCRGCCSATTYIQCHVRAASDGCAALQHLSFVTLVTPQVNIKNFPGYMQPTAMDEVVQLQAVE